MLRSQAGLWAPSAQALDRKCSPSDCRQRQGRTQDLAAAYAMRSVDDDAVTHPYELSVLLRSVAKEGVAACGSDSAPTLLQWVLAAQVG
jgi:hypothetical protein